MNMARRRGAAPAPRRGRKNPKKFTDPFAGAKVWTREEIDAFCGSGPPEETAEEIDAARRSFRERYI